MREIIDLDRVSTYSWSEIASKTNLKQTFYKTDKGELEIPTEIADKLIRLAAKWTNRFASDLIISIDSMRKEFLNKLKDEKCSDYLIVYFGFRKDGVDHKEFIECKSPLEYCLTYSEVWRIEIYHNPFEDEIEWKMRMLSDYINDSDLIEVE